jgi:hypothetical protein
MHKNQSAEFHKYLAMLIYEYNKSFYSENISKESRTEIEEILLALEKVQKICIIDMENK